jgi:hypothetical protein
VFSSRQLTAGTSPAELEEASGNTTTTRLRVALAVDADDDTAIDKSLTGGSARRVAIAVVTMGAHKAVHDYMEVVKAARLATGDLRKLAS